MYNYKMKKVFRVKFTREDTFGEGQEVGSVSSVNFLINDFLASMHQEDILPRVNVSSIKRVSVLK